MVGQEGSGKTTILADLLARATRGQLDGDLLGVPVGAVYATAEDSWSRTLAPRLLAAGADLDQIFFVKVDGIAGGLTVPDDLVALAERMRQTGAQILVLDPLGAHLGERLDTHRDASVRRALAPLASQMEALNGAAIGIMHWSKAPTLIALDRVNGSRGFTAAARSMLAVADHPDDDNSKVLVLAKSNLGPLDVATLSYRIEGRQVDGTDGETVTTSGVAWLGEAPGVTRHDIFRAETSEEQAIARDTEATLLELLDRGPMERSAVKKALKDAGYDISDKSLQRICTRLGIRRVRAGFGSPYMLELPTEDASEGQASKQEEGTVQHVHHVQVGHHQGGSGPHGGQEPLGGLGGQPGRSPLQASAKATLKWTCSGCGAPSATFYGMNGLMATAVVTRALDGRATVRIVTTGLGQPGIVTKSSPVAGTVMYGLCEQGGFNASVTLTT